MAAVVDLAVLMGALLCPWAPIQTKEDSIQAPLHKADMVDSSNGNLIWVWIRIDITRNGLLMEWDSFFCLDGYPAEALMRVF